MAKRFFARRKYPVINLRVISGHGLLRKVIAMSSNNFFALIPSLIYIYWLNNIYITSVKIHNSLCPYQHIVNFLPSPMLEVFIPFNPC